MIDDELKDHLAALFEAQEQFIDALFREMDAKLDRALADLADLGMRQNEMTQALLARGHDTD